MKTIHTQTIYTNVVLQNKSDYRHVIEREAILNPERFSFYCYGFDPASMRNPEYQLISQNQKEFTDGRIIYPILKPAYRTNENRLGIVSLIPDGATLIETDGAPSRCVHPSLTLPAKVQI